MKALSHLSLICFSLVVVGGCSSRESVAPVDEWAVDRQPVQLLGVEQGAAEFEFSRTSDVLVMPNGTFIIANSGTSELRQFSGNGELVRTAGREGEGPREFSGSPLLLQLAAPDTIVVFDTGNWRLTSLDSTLHLIAAVDAASADLSGFEWYPRVYPSAYLIADDARAARGCVGDALKQIVAGHPAWPAALVHVDRLGYLWTTALPLDATRPAQWNVADLSGQSVATAQLPAGFTPFVIADSGIVGRLVDSSGVEQVAEFRLTRRSATAQVCSIPRDTAAAPDTMATTALRQTLSMVVVAQEGYYANHGTYARRGEDVHVAGMPDARLVMVAADKRHWVGLLIDNRSGATCALGIGPEPAGWHEAIPQCT